MNEADSLISDPFEVGNENEEQRGHSPDLELGPGRKLRELREEHNLTIKEIASQIKLTPAAISRIEADDYSGFSAPIFVKGYLKSYAYILGVDAKDIMTRFDTLNVSFKGEKVNRGSYVTVQTQEALLRRMSLLIIGILFALALGWWHGHKSRAGVAVDLASARVADSSIATTPSTVSDSTATQSDATPSQTASSEVASSKASTHQAQSNDAPSGTAQKLTSQNTIDSLNFELESQ